jgi:hypothetical protein
VQPTSTAALASDVSPTNSRPAVEDMRRVYWGDAARRG